MAPNTEIDDDINLELFSMGDSDILPSEQRRRLSAQLRGSTTEEEKEFFDRRRKSLILQHPEHESFAIPSKANNTRRASVLTDLFARSSTSDSFIENNIKPTVIMALVYFKEPEPDEKKLRKVLGERLLEIPRFSSIFRMENNVVYCDSIPKESVDLEYHIQCVESSKEDDELSKRISEASSEWWDATKPLWKFTLITNMKDGRSLLFCKIDHAVGDGVALLAVLRALLDDPPAGAKQSFQHRRAVPPPLYWSQRAMCFIGGCYEGIIGWAIKPVDPENGLKIPSDANLKDGKTHKTFTQTRIFPLKEIKELKNKLRSSSVNDIMMAVITIGIRKYLQHTNDPVLRTIDGGAKSLQGMVVINTRNVSNKDKAVTNLGNDFQGVSFQLPLQYNNEIEAVWKSKFIVDQWKISPQLFLQKQFSFRLLQMLPESALISATFENIRKPTCMISNVMGPDFECTLGNYVVDDINFLASSGLGLYVGILSYNQKMRISFATDILANIDNSLLTKSIEEAYDDLRSAIMNDPNEFIEPPQISLFSVKVLGYVIPVFAAVTATIYFKFLIEH